MHGSTARQAATLGTIDPEHLIPAGHPIHRVRPLLEAVLREL
ncbi:MAG: hypothetical protein ACRENY_07165 [Candidatus Dormibacteria bacterium]